MDQAGRRRGGEGPLDGSKLTSCLFAPSVAGRGLMLGCKAGAGVQAGSIGEQWVPFTTAQGEEWGPGPAPPLTPYMAAVISPRTQLCRTDGPSNKAGEGRDGTDWGTGRVPGSVGVPRGRALQALWPQEQSPAPGVPQPSAPCAWQGVRAHRPGRWAPSRLPPPRLPGCVVLGPAPSWGAAAQERWCHGKSGQQPRGGFVPAEAGSFLWAGARPGCSAPCRPGRALPRLKANVFPPFCSSITLHQP